MGFGSGYHIEPFLKRKNVNNILVIDNNLGYLKAQLRSRDLRKIILDPRVHFLIDADAAEVREYLLSHCFPVLTGDIQAIPLRSRINLEPEYFSDIFRLVKETLGILADDFTVQTSFGKKWFSNTLTNLEKAERTTKVLDPVSRVLVTAAGPSLENGLKELNREDYFLIATDTSYPALRKMKIKPDLAISIDCQHISYHHFLSGFDRTIPLVLDLASPPGLTRITDSPIFFTSGHPFSIYINRYWRSFPFIDTSGGNVTHAAVSLAEHLGAAEVDIVGADFCYPYGKSYSRGTYIYPHFHSSSLRNSSAEFLFFDFIFNNRQIEEVEVSGDRVYRTYALTEYMNRFSHTFSDRKMRVRNLSPYHEKEKPDYQNNSLSSGSETIPFFGSGPVSAGWNDFIRRYRESLRSLPAPANPIAGYFEQITPEMRGLWLTIFPAAASIRKQYSHENLDTAGILNLAYEWTISIIDRYITS